MCRCFIGSFPQNAELIRFIQFSRIGFYERRRSIHDGRPCRNNSSSEGAREKMRYIQLLELSAFSRQLVYITRSKHYANYPWRSYIEIKTSIYGWVGGGWGVIKMSTVRVMSAIDPGVFVMITVIRLVLMWAVHQSTFIALTAEPSGMDRS